MPARPAPRPALALFLLLAPVFATLPGTTAAETPAEAREREAKVADEAARKALVRGPSTIQLKDEASLALPERFGYIPVKEAAELMRVMGNTTDENFLGLIVPLGDEDAHWLVEMRHEAAGYIKDDDAKNWDAAKLLDSLKEGTEAANAHREEIGIPPIVVTRWIEPPAYEAPTHRLVWAAEAKLKNGTDDDPTVNYNTYVLGRDGYISLNLITEASAVERDKAAARRLLGLVAYNKGKDYGDFNSSTDKVAAYGLAALVAGVAAKKLGLLALLAATIVKFAKVILIAIAAFGAGIAKWFKSRFKRSEPPA
jgi:uncharacterized membrane-anchored protein